MNGYAVDFSLYNDGKPIVLSEPVKVTGDELKRLSSREIVDAGSASGMRAMETFRRPPCYNSIEFKFKKVKIPRSVERRDEV